MDKKMNKNIIVGLIIVFFVAGCANLSPAPRVDARQELKEELVGAEPPVHYGIHMRTEISYKGYYETDSLLEIENGRVAWQNVESFSQGRGADWNYKYQIATPDRNNCTSYDYWYDYLSHTGRLLKHVCEYVAHDERLLTMEDLSGRVLQELSGIYPEYSTKDEIAWKNITRKEDCFESSYRKYAKGSAYQEICFRDGMIISFDENLTYYYGMPNRPEKFSWRMIGLPLEPMEVGQARYAQFNPDDAVEVSRPRQYNSSA
ncbi:hypothetical protein HQ545_01320 [Candidatus Woesearchaeota archaeon]|nr:hypothetical protein [Candidatus Woesearchaeota archaeon]